MLSPRYDASLDPQIRLIRLFENSIQRYMDFCRQNPEAILQMAFKTSRKYPYFLGFWWLSLTPEQKEVTRSMYSMAFDFDTVESYSALCSRILVPNNRLFVDRVIENFPINIASELAATVTDADLQAKFTEILRLKWNA
ncbi:hypothetical protein HC928_15825 [bacterium]|nr:hypothetical protein [bacterium]